MRVFFDQCGAVRISGNSSFKLLVALILLCFPALATQVHAQYPLLLSSCYGSEAEFSYPGGTFRVPTTIPFSIVNANDCLKEPISRATVAFYPRDSSWKSIGVNLEGFSPEMIDVYQVRKAGILPINDILKQKFAETPSKSLVDSQNGRITKIMDRDFFRINGLRTPLENSLYLKCVRYTKVRHTCTANFLQNNYVGVKYVFTFYIGGTELMPGVDSVAGIVNLHKSVELFLKQLGL